MPASGGGLSAGIGLAVRDCRRRRRRSCWSSRRASTITAARSPPARSSPIERQAGSVCDALLICQPGALSFAINRAHAAAGVAVSDDEALAAVAFAFRELKLVVEPGGAVALAAVLAGRVAARGRTLVVVLSGGNIDLPVLAEALAGANELRPDFGRLGGDLWGDQVSETIDGEAKTDVRLTWSAAAGRGRSAARPCRAGGAGGEPGRGGDGQRLCPARRRGRLHRADGAKTARSTTSPPPSPSPQPASPGR